MSKFFSMRTVPLMFATALAMTSNFAQAANNGAPQPYPCAVSNDWITAPNPPQEVPDGANAQFCQFYQFSWQWFLQLVQPSNIVPTVRNFEVDEFFPQLRTAADGTSLNSCGTGLQGTRQFKLVGLKARHADGSEVVSKAINQAGSTASIYDKHRNVVYYEVRFSRDMCGVTSGGNFPSGITEIKTAWRVLTKEDDARRYYSVKTVVQGASDKPMLLGLVGFHLARSTTLHPEFVWATFEHKDNSPDCFKHETVWQRPSKWSFASDEAARCLQKEDPFTCSLKFPYNGAGNSSFKGDQGAPTPICRVYPNGTRSTDNKAAENNAVVDELNRQLVGPKGLLTKLDDKNPMAVWKNYFNVGAIWFNQPAPTDPDQLNADQRGSLQLASSVMETTYQGGAQKINGKISFNNALNCFACHSYSPTQPTTTSGVSHIFNQIHGTKK